MQLFLTIALGLMTAAATAYIAQQRGRDPLIWFILGLFLSIYALLLVFILPPVKEESETVMESVGSSDTAVHLPAVTHDYFIKDWYYYDSERKQQGPVRFEQLKELWNSSQINAHSFVWSEGMPGWQKIEEIQSLYSHLVEPLPL